MSITTLGTIVVICRTCTYIRNSVPEDDFRIRAFPKKEPQLEIIQ